MGKRTEIMHSEKICTPDFLPVPTDGMPPTYSRKNSDQLPAPLFVQPAQKTKRTNHARTTAPQPELPHPFRLNSKKSITNSTEPKKRIQAPPSTRAEQLQPSKTPVLPLSLYYRPIAGFFRRVRVFILPHTLSGVYGAILGG